jgi:hypothetical protein
VLRSGRHPALSAVAPPSHAEANDGQTALDLLRELVAGQRRIIELLERGHRPTTLNRTDRTRLAQLLPAIAGALGSELFHSADIFEHDAAALRLVRAGLSPKQLGRLLRRAAGQPIDGYVVEREGIETGAVLWRVKKHVPEFPGNEKVSVPRGPTRTRA